MATATADMLRRKLCCGSETRPGKRLFSRPNQKHNFLMTRGLTKLFRNAISDGSARSWGKAFTPVISTLANALAFISMSTSA